MYYSLISSMKKFSYNVIDPDALAFITAAAITDNTQKLAIDTLVISLKSYGIWTKMKAIYPMVGGTASTHKFNLKDPRDLNAAFRLTFLGGWTHNLLAATANGSNGYADTFFNIQNLNQNNSHLSIYNTNNYTASSIGTIDFGAFEETTIDGAFIATEVVPGLSRARMFKNPLDYSLTNNTGYYIVNSTTINSKYFINNVIRSTIANSGVFPHYINGLIDGLGTYKINSKSLTQINSGLSQYSISSIEIIQLSALS